MLKNNEFLFLSLIFSPWTKTLGPIQKIVLVTKVEKNQLHNKNYKKLRRKKLERLKMNYIWCTEQRTYSLKLLAIYFLEFAFETTDSILKTWYH